MVISGRFSLADLIRYLEPENSAKYIAFETLADPKQMPGIRSVTSFIDWPYREGLRMDEALNELLIASVYMGKIYPQMGRLSLVVPWLWL